MAAAYRGLVHDVVVEQRRQVGQLDGDRGGHDPLVAAVTEPGGEQHEHGPEALAAGLHHVPGDLGEHLVAAEGGVLQGCFDDGEVLGHLRAQGRVGEVDGNSDGHTNSMSSARIRTHQFTRLPACGISQVAGGRLPLPTTLTSGERRAATGEGKLGYRTNNCVAAWLASESIGLGTMPNTTADRAPRPTAVPVNTEGRPPRGRRAPGR